MGVLLSAKVSSVTTNRFSDGCHKNPSYCPPWSNNEPGWGNH